MANFKLKYNTDKHTKIREAIRDRIKAGESVISKKSTEWAANEERMQMYIKETEADAVRKAKRDGGKPQLTTVDVPFSYAMLMSWHTYIASVFFARAPILQFSGRHGETEQQVQAVEATLDYQTQVGGHLIPYYLWILDAGKYGAGIVGEYWEEETRQVSSIVERPVTYLGIPITGKTEKVKQTQTVPGFVGNKIFNVRPQDFFFDSRVSIMNFQDGEFCGRNVDLGWNGIVKRQAYGQYYNVEELKKFKKASKNQTKVGDRDTGSSQLELPDAATGSPEHGVVLDEMSPTFTSLQELHVELIPSDWGLGESAYP